MSMSIEMLKVSQSSGVTDIILTPHHLNGVFTNFVDSVIEKTTLLQLEADKNDLDIKLHYGSEVHIVPETVEHLVENKALTYCGLGKAALVELPKSSIPHGVERILSELIYHGITPIIAHPERNSSLRRDMEPLKDWIEFGCKAQLTGQSCSGSFGESIQALSFEMIAQNLIHLVASDAHRPNGRSPNLTKAASTLSHAFNDDVCDTLLHSNPLRLINGENLVNLKIDASETNYLKGKNKRKKEETNKRWFHFFKR